MNLSDILKEVTFISLLNHLDKYESVEKGEMTQGEFSKGLIKHFAYPIAAWAALTFYVSTSLAFESPVPWSQEWREGFQDVWEYIKHSEQKERPKSTYNSFTQFA